MFSAMIASMRQTLSALVAAESPNELTAGFALGLVIAVMPTGHIIALSVCVLLFSLRCGERLSLEAVA
jgi:uncharacterized protein (DUF2062 family)